MRIFALLTDGFGAHGGIGQFNRDLLTALSRSAAVDEIVALPRFGATTTTPAKIRQLPPSARRAGWTVRAIRVAITERPDLIFCGHLNAVPLAALIARLANRPLWLQVHGIEAWSDRGETIRRAVSAATLVTSVSRHTRARLLAWTHIVPERVRVLPNTLADIYRPRTRSIDLAERHHVEGRRIILTVGRLASAERYKGHDRIIRALPRLRESFPTITYVIVGSGDDEARLRDLACSEGVTTLVVFTGTVSPDELPDYYAFSDVFAMPSTGEGFGIVFLEAAAAGLPVIGGNRDGSVDALADGAVGAAVDPLDSEALVAALTAALHGENTRQPDAVCRFAFENFARHVDDLVRSLVS